MFRFLRGYERARQCGCDDCDIKPLEFPRLLGKIQSLLRNETRP